MKYSLLIRFNGCLNGRRNTTINLILLEFEAIDRGDQLSMCELTNYLYQKRGKGELGRRNGPGTAGWLEVIKVNTAKPLWFLNDCKVVTVNSFAIKKVYEQIKDELKLAIDEKIKIQKKKEAIEERPKKKKKKKGVKRIEINT